LRASQLLLPIAGLIALGLYAQKTAAGYLNYYIRSVALSFDGIVPVLKVDLNIQNPSNQQSTIRSITGNVSANGKNIGNFSMFETIQVNPNSQVILPVYVRLAVVPIVSDLVTLILRGSGNSVEIDLKGFVNANNIVSSIDLTYKII